MLFLGSKIARVVGRTITIPLRIIAEGQRSGLKTGYFSYNFEPLSQNGIDYLVLRFTPGANPNFYGPRVIDRKISLAKSDFAKGDSVFLVGQGHTLQVYETERQYRFLRNSGENFRRVA